MSMAASMGGGRVYSVPSSSFVFDSGWAMMPPLAATFPGAFATRSDPLIAGGRGNRKGGDQIFSKAPRNAAMAQREVAASYYFAIRDTSASSILGSAKLSAKQGSCAKICEYFSMLCSFLIGQVG